MIEVNYICDICGTVVQYSHVGSTVPEDWQFCDKYLCCHECAKQVNIIKRQSWETYLANVQNGVNELMEMT